MNGRMNISWLWPASHHDTTNIQGLCGFKTFPDVCTNSKSGQGYILFGHDNIPLELTTTSSFFNATTGGATPNAIAPNPF